MFNWFDSHVHLDDPRFDQNRGEVVRRARHAKVTAFIVPGVARQSWSRTRQIARGIDQAWPIYGLHPYFLEQHGPADIDALDRWIARERPCAIGEAGLDFFLSDLDRARQMALFEAQLELAEQHALPIVLHARKSLDTIIQSLRRHTGVRAQIHAFSGSAQQASQLIDTGALISIGSSITFERAQRLRRVVAGLPLDRLSLESDAPDQPGSGHRGELNEPAFLPEAAAVIAELKHCEIAEIAHVTAANTCAFFGLEPALEPSH